MSARLDTVLRGAAADAAWPPTPDLAARVVARIEAGGLVPGGGGAAPVGVRPAAVPRPAALRLGRALAFALLTLLLVAGLATAMGYRLPGLDLLFVDRVPPAGDGLDLGTPIALGEARSLDRPRVLVPADLPAPDTAYTRGTGIDRIVTLAYRATPGQPTLAGSDLAVTVMAVPGDTRESLIGKNLGPGTSLEPVTVGGSRGWWIAGAPHEVLFLRPDGSVGVQAPALAGDTLLFARDGTLYRLESALGRDATIALAESMH